MSNTAQILLSFGILGGVGYAIYKGRFADQQPATGGGVINASYTPASTAPQASYAPASTATAPVKSWQQALLGGVLGAFDGQIVKSTGGNNGLGDFISGVFGNGTKTGAATGHTPTSTDYGQTPFGQTAIGHRLKLDLMSDFDFTSNQAAGIVGNLHAESAGFTKLQEIQPMEWRGGQLVPSKTNRGGYGYAQWTGPRRRAFERWAASNGLDVSSYAANYGFLRYEMTSTGERRVVSKLKRTTTAAEAAKVFEITYLRPGIPHSAMRAAFAERYA